MEPVINRFEPVLNRLNDRGNFYLKHGLRGLHGPLWKEGDETNIMVVKFSQCWTQFWPFGHFWPNNLDQKRAKTANFLLIFGFLEQWFQYWGTSVPIAGPVPISEPLDWSEPNRLQTLLETNDLPCNLLMPYAKVCTRLPPRRSSWLEFWLGKFPSSNRCKSRGHLSCTSLVPVL